MTCTVVLGTQWGDEGKGKVTDLLSERSDAIVRFQGGNNAGHTIVVGGRTVKLHIIPSGVLHPGKLAVIGDGCVVDPWVLLKELDYLRELGVDTSGVVLSDRAHLIMPYHRLMDTLQESLRAGGSKVGTTGRGIGPCYQDRAGRFGVRAGDLRFPRIVRERVAYSMRVLRALSSEAGMDLDLSEEQVLADCQEAYSRLEPLIADAPSLLNRLVREGKEVLLEGAQGQFLDIDRGTYPFVTSSSCTAGNASSGSGIGPRNIERIVGVVKAYTTRVGEGPFPTELVDDTGERLRRVGHEFGTTTSRPRRCGWLDLVIVRSSVAWNTIDSLAVTKLDVLDGIDPIKVCLAYELDGCEMEMFPSHLSDLARCRPVYAEMPGWGNPDWEGMRGKGELEGRIEEYLSLIAKEAGAKISIVSYGPGREQTITR